MYIFFPILASFFSRKLWITDRKTSEKLYSNIKYKLEDRSQKKKIMFLLFCIAKTKRPEKDIKVSAKVLRKCFVSSLILLWQPKSAQSALSSTVFKI